MEIDSTAQLHGDSTILKMTGEPTGALASTLFI